MLRPGPQPTRVALSQRASRRLWVVAVLDMTAVAWMIAIGNWLDKTSRLTAVITLGGHHLLVLKRPRGTAAAQRAGVAHLHRREPLLDHDSSIQQCKALAQVSLGTTDRN
jgi:hypothetical protein